MLRVMALQRLAASIDVRRALRGLLAFLVVTALVVPAQGGVFCHMAERVMSSCCCASMAAEDDEPPCEAPEAVDTPCCDSVGRHALSVPSTQTLDKTSVAAAKSSAAGAPRLEPLRLPAPLVTILAVHARAPVLARGSPPRRGKLRARISVTIC
jgi:hypothetical protein